MSVEKAGETRHFLKKWYSLFGLLALAALFIPLISHNPATVVCKYFHYDLNNEYWTYPPIEGLDVTFGQGQYPSGELWTRPTNADGRVCFGSGLPDGDYWFEWDWGGTTDWEQVTINCSQLEWVFRNYLPAKGLWRINPKFRR